MALEDAPTVGERFETAVDLDRLLRPKQKRCGTTLSGFLLALEDLPLDVFGELRTGLQRAVLRANADPARVGRWNAFGLDGTKQNLPRTDANELGFGAATKDPALPQGLTVAAVALGQRVLWDWESGGIHASERDLALQIMRRLPAGSLGVEDAGFVGHEHISDVLASGRHVLMRVGGNIRLWADKIGSVQQRGGEVWLWPNRRRAEAPLRLRLIKIVTRKKKTVKRKKRKGPGRRQAFKIVQRTLWLVTDVLDETALTQAEAEELYGRRWGGNEIRFRDWKCTLQAATLLSHTPRQAQRERELSLCAAMLLHVLVTRARQSKRKPFRAVSAARAVRAWRRAVRQSGQGKSTRWFGGALSEAVVDNYPRRRPKVKRRWPKRKDHTEAGKPQFRKLTARIKAMGLKRLEEKWA